MPSSWNSELAGRIDEVLIDTDMLRGNPLSDPASRPVWIYTPPGYRSAPLRRYPTVYLLHANIDQLATHNRKGPGGRFWRQPTSYSHPARRHPAS